MIAQLATEASRLVREKKVTNIPNAIRQVLEAHNMSRNPDMYTKIASELGARGARKKQMGRVSRAFVKDAQNGVIQNDDSVRQAFEREQLFRDARAHELRQPPSTYDLDHPENSP